MVKVKVKFTLEQAMKAQRGRIGITSGVPRGIWGVQTPSPLEIPKF
jgi:hypothetical protein